MTGCYDVVGVAVSGNDRCDDDWLIAASGTVARYVRCDYEQR